MQVFFLKKSLFLPKFFLRLCPSFYKAVFVPSGCVHPQGHPSIRSLKPYANEAGEKIFPGSILLNYTNSISRKFFIFSRTFTKPVQQESDCNHEDSAQYSGNDCPQIQLNKYQLLYPQSTGCETDNQNVVCLQKNCFLLIIFSPLRYYLPAFFK